MVCRAGKRVSMQQSRLEQFFSSKKTSPNEKKSTMNNSNNKRLSTADDQTKTMKRIKSDDEPIESQFSLNDFYLEKFLFILSTLLEHHQSLFNDHELNLFQRFRTLNCSSQIIFIRLLMRRCKWIRQSSMNYGLNDDLSPLVENGFLQDISTLENLDEALRLLTAEEMREFSKRFHCQSKANQSKKVSIENLKNLSQQYKSVFGSTSTHNRDHLLLKELKKILKNSFKISEDVRGLFFRMMLLHHPVALQSMDDLDQNGFSLLYKMFQISRGQLRLPWNVEQVSHADVPFRTAEHLKIYQQTIDLENEFYQLEQSKNLEALLDFYQTHNESWRHLINQPAEDERLPGYFRRFSADYVRARLLSSFTEILQRARRYEESMELIEFLLDRPAYNRHRRGKLWNRLALIQENYLKTDGHQQCLNTIHRALQDPAVKLGERLALCDRARKLISKPKSKSQLPPVWMKDSKSTLLWNVPMPREIEVIGRLMANDARMGKVTYTIQDEHDGSIQFCTVEQLAIHHYRTEENFSYGIHSEGSIIRTFVGLLFLDIIYNLPRSDLLIDVFQTEPLDFQTDSFYESRQSQIDQRISQISSEQKIEEIAENNWDKYNLTMSSMVNWDLFQSKSILINALKCLTPEQIQSISSYTFVHNRAVWKGFPDLFVWNPSRKKCKFVEVKSHNDRLSFHQIVWLDKLLEWKIDCEVCKVNANGTKKKLQRNSSVIELD